MQINLTLPGSIRIKKNSKRIFKRGKFTIVLPSKGYEIWEEEARASVLTQDYIYSDMVFFKVKMLAYYKGNRPDLSGAMESVGDCLEGIIWKDDRQIEAWHGDSRVIHDLKNPRTEVEIWVIGNGN